MSVSAEIQRQGASHSSPAPQTPQPPISPPKRNSSLAFSNVQRLASSKTNTIRDGSTRSISAVTPHIYYGNRQFHGSPSVRDTPSQVRKVLQAARGALHRDMFTASSPVGSIESRMHLEQLTPFHIDTGLGSDIREWRYSTAPYTLATISNDVREPLPSPVLPSAPIENDDFPILDDPVEPASSGFVSPLAPQTTSNVVGIIQTVLRADNSDALDGTDHEIDEEPVTLEDIDTHGVTHSTELDQSLHRLTVDDSESGLDSSEESPTVKHLNRRSHGGSIDAGTELSPRNGIYLSETAEAAANSAKAKRRWLKGIFLEDREEDQDLNQRDGDEVDLPDLPDLGVICPDPTAHRMSSGITYPESSLHGLSPNLYRRPMSALELAPVPSRPDQGKRLHNMPAAGHPRATATGSPMPFTRLKSRCSTSNSDYQSLRLSPTLLRREAEIATMNEHFQPGWYYSRDDARPSPRPTYSFSTAASKISGSDQAPDSRMRDSYKTDTLTALPIPTSRYRKNGIGADLPPRGLGRYYQRPPSSTRTHNSRSRPNSRQTYASGSDVRFRSSPPRASGPDQFPRMRRKRAIDDSLMVGEGIYSDGIDPEMRLHASDDMMQVDDQTKAAVRMSIFGTNTPEALRKARQGIKELSPNVQVYRKALQEGHHRKKRRPSYWDNDLKEIRESPAGRGGVRSPVSAQESMRADFEIASHRDVEMDLGGDDVEDQVVGLGRH